MPEIDDYQKDSEELRIKVEDLVTDFICKYPNVISIVSVDIAYATSAVPETHATVHIQGIIKDISPTPTFRRRKKDESE